MDEPAQTESTAETVEPTTGTPGERSATATVEPTTGTPGDQPAAVTSYDIALPDGLAKAIADQWEPAPRMPHPASPSSAREAGASPAGAGAAGAGTAAANRRALSRHFPGDAVVVPAGQLVPRANDTDYPFRAWSGFTWLTGETVESAVLVLAPVGAEHQATLYVREYAGAGQTGYFTNRRYGALWVGNVPSPAETEAVLGLPVRPLTDLSKNLGTLGSAKVLSPRGVDAELDALLPGAEPGSLVQVLDELRLVKNDWEIDQLRVACAATARGFEDVAAALPAVLAAGGRRGERWLEGTFWRRARMEGNEVGYTSILGAGPHATTLHWWRNDGDLADGQLLLADMGVEIDSLYTADITRTMPVDGEFTATQRQLYSAVLEAQQAGIGEVKAGADFLAAHRAAMWVLADHLHSWGILPVTADVACATDVQAPGAGLHRRYTLHGVSHMLGIDVHDCANAREEVYRNGTLGAGYVLTVEPGLYFQPNDLSVPPEWRGIGIRIEDDILVTDGEPVNLSADIPREPDELTAWMRDAQSRPTAP